MLSGLLTYLAERSWAGLLRDAVDILVVYYGCYRALLVLRGTRAMQVGIGLLVVMVLYGLARLFELATVLSIMGTLFSSLLLIIVVVFQSDIRRGLQRIGSQAIFSRFTRGPETKVIDEVVEAATELARHRIGALVAFEQDANLDEFVGAHKGHLVDAAVTRELLVSLFLPEAVNRLHDGAVIIRNLRIAKAGVFFPMPEQGVVDESFGSRHRAALGITEETDAVVVVVSEERGNISFCFNGNIASNLDGPKLRTMLEAVFSPKAAQKKAQAGRRSVARRSHRDTRSTGASGGGYRHGRASVHARGSRSASCGLELVGARSRRNRRNPSDSRSGKRKAATVAAACQCRRRSSFHGARIDARARNAHCCAAGTDPPRGRFSTLAAAGWDWRGPPGPAGRAQ